MLVRRSADRFTSRTDGVWSRHSFSFGEHYDPARVSFGALLVSNEDVVQTGTGYGTHPHRDAEIVTWVLSGSLVHEDSAGNIGVIYPGLAQRMSAGSGIVHAERNDGFRLDPSRPREPVHFMQMWLRPDVAGAVPGYAAGEVDLPASARGWVPLVSGVAGDAAVGIGTRDATLWMTRLPAGVSRGLPDGARLYAQVVTGEVTLEAAGDLAAGDSAAILGSGGQRVTATADAELLVWTLP